MPGVEITEFPDTVLVVDDEPIVIQVLERVLSLRKIKVATASSAEEALERLRREEFGCLLADKNLPSSDGLSLIAETRRLQPHCACILMTGYASTSSAVQALRLGAIDYLQKPFKDVELVAEKVCMAIEKQRTQFDRQRFLARLREFEAELKRKDSESSAQRTEIDMFNEILEARIELAMADLQRERDQLIAQMRQGCAPEDAEIVGIEMAVMLVEDLQQRPELDVPPLRGELQKVVQQLRSHLKRLRGPAAA